MGREIHKSSSSFLLKIFYFPLFPLFLYLGASQAVFTETEFIHGATLPILSVQCLCLRVVLLCFEVLGNTRDTPEMFGIFRATSSSVQGAIWNWTLNLGPSLAYANNASLTTVPVPSLTFLILLFVMSRDHIFGRSVLRLYTLL